jgi:hypothetical protein
MDHITKGAKSLKVSNTDGDRAMWPHQHPDLCTVPIASSTKGGKHYKSNNVWDKRSSAHPTNLHPTTAMLNSDSGSVMRAIDKQQPACEGL